MEHFTAHFQHKLTRRVVYRATESKLLMPCKVIKLWLMLKRMVSRWIINKDNVLFHLCVKPQKSPHQSCLCVLVSLGMPSLPLQISTLSSTVVTWTFSAQLQYLVLFKEFDEWSCLWLSSAGVSWLRLETISCIRDIDYWTENYLGTLLQH